MRLVPQNTMMRVPGGSLLRATNIVLHQFVRAFTKSVAACHPQGTLLKRSLMPTQPMVARQQSQRN